MLALSVVSVDASASSSSQECTIAADGTEACADDAHHHDGPPTAPPEENEAEDRDESRPCVDEIGATKCQKLAVRNGCIQAFPTMREQCAATCLVCGQSVDDMDEAALDQTWKLPRLYSDGFPQLISGSQRMETYRYLQDVDQYMHETVYMDDEFKDVRKDCQNRHELCTFWAFLGECTNNPSYMKMQCAAACFTCDQLLFENRCPFDPDAPTAMKAGDLDAMFERIMTADELAQFSPKALMRPNPPATAADAAAVEGTAEESLEGPWIVVLENFLSPEECETMIRLGGEKGYERSQDVGAKKFDGTYDSTVSKDRTSSNAWCTEECYSDPVMERIHERLELLTGIPRINYEYLQLLQYEETQHYGDHHDYITHHVQRAPGVRVSICLKKKRIFAWFCD